MAINNKYFASGVHYPLILSKVFPGDADINDWIGHFKCIPLATGWDNTSKLQWQWQERLVWHSQDCQGALKRPRIWTASNMSSVLSKAKRWNFGEYGNEFCKLANRAYADFQDDT